MENKQCTKILFKLIQNFYDSGHNHKVVIQKSDQRKEDVLQCDSWQVHGNKEWRQWTWPQLLAKSLLSAVEVRVSNWISSHEKHIDL